jgi:hypothetical protein
MRLASLLLFALFALARPAAAQVVPSPYRFIEKAQSLGVYGGYLATSRGTRDLGPHSGPLVGLQYRGRFAGPMSGEVDVSYLRSRRTVYVQSLTSLGTLVPIGVVDAPIVIGEAGLHFALTGPRTWHSLAPYLGATAGVVTDLAGTSQLEKDALVPSTQSVSFGPSFAVGGSAGTDWFLTDRLSIGAAGRGYIWRFSTPATLAGTASAQTSWLRNFGGTIGVAVHF